MDEPTAALAAHEVEQLVRAGRAAQGPRPRGLLHLAPPQGGVRDRRADHRAQGRQAGEDRREHRGDLAAAGPADGRPRARPVLPAAGRRRHARAGPAQAARRRQRPAARTSTWTCTPGRSSASPASRGRAGPSSPARSSAPTPFAARHARARRQGAAHRLPARRDRRRDRVRHRGPQGRGAGALAVDPRQREPRLARAAGAPLRREHELEVGTLVKAVELRFRGLGQEVRFLSGGNQQKVVLGEVARDRAAAGDLRRADARHRRRRQGRHPRPDPRSRRTRASPW